MSFLNYFKDHLLSIFLYLMGLGFTIFSLWALKVNSFLIGEIAFVLITVGVLIFLIEYIRVYRYFNSVLKTLAGLDKKYLVHELHRAPMHYEGKLLYDIMCEVDKAMMDHVNFYKHNMEDFKEYIELWVHEIKIPLASARLIMENNPNIDLQDEIKRVEDYVEQVLFYARSENVEKDYMIKLCSLDQMVKNVIKRNRKDFIYKKISLEYEPLNIEVYTDLKWMEFVLNQIIANSIKYSKVEEAYIKIEVQENKNNVVLMIEDNGIGISKEDLPRVFEKGFTGKTGRNHDNSTGIGLYLCKKLCDKLHHQIRIDSTLDNGVKVWIEFPKSSFIDIIKN